MINYANYIDEALLQAIFREQEQWLQANRPWLTGILQQKMEPEPVVRMASMVRQRWGLLPQVDLNQPAIEIGKDAIKTTTAEMARFYAKQSIYFLSCRIYYGIPFLY